MNTLTPAKKKLAVAISGLRAVHPNRRCGDEPEIDRPLGLVSLLLGAVNAPAAEP
jgi:hypothetical protein